MDTFHLRCCGLDVHKKSVVACAITPEGRETRTFRTMTGDLLTLADWLRERRVSQVAMESTGVYWKPVYNLLEDEFTVMMVNAAHIKAVPGRKTDVKDAEWIAELLQHGLLRASFIPDRPQRELRELTRYRRSMVQERSREANRVQKLLEGANIKLASVATDVLGASGRAMLSALAAGEEDPQVLAGLAKGRLREKTGELEQALRGLVGDHQRFMLTAQLRHLDFLNSEIERLDQETARRVQPFEETVAAVDTIPGVGRRTAEVIMAEIGADMTRFPTSGHLASWSGVCPGNRQSGEKRKPSPTRKANNWLRSALVEAARAAGRTKTYLGAQYRRLARRIGANRAAMAVAHSIVVILHHVIRSGQVFVDLGSQYFEERDRTAITRQAVRRLEGLGHRVTLAPA
ncbi:MAG: IS110 family transposase [Chloroflexota bacterium]|nr:IS110 family transposase [Chloroflexota bacterium]